ncbi:hypothetical protein AB0I94_03685 [Streptomyces sp. NPDC050147]|uniref:hypothetical protein n=1 Tax=Streptomyces sp. NPDC050147 TaxID=3155513 RepID=UPI0034414028
MADEDYRWLDRDTAERLLSGEPIDGTDHHTQEQAAQLAKALAALTADDRAGAVVPADVSSELPGEAAALAAFREARGPKARTASTRVGAGETVRIGRSAALPPVRWARPLRYGLAAVLAGCMIGGVAVAAGTGVLPSPFGDREQPGPAASASSVASPEPLASPSKEPSSTPDVEPDDVTTTPEDPSREPGSSAPTQEAEDSEGASKGGTAGTTRPGSGDSGRENEANDFHRKVVSACRDYRSGELQGEKRRRLEEAAKGSQRVTEFCGRVLGGTGSDREHNGGGSDSGGKTGGKTGGGNGGNGGSDDDGDKGGGGDKSDGDGSSGGGNDHGGHEGSRPAPPVVAPTTPRSTPTPTASYSAQPVLPGS